MENLIPITLACKELSITARTLRYYEEEGLLYSKRKENLPIRYYTEDEILKAKEIILLREYGFSIRNIKQFYNRESSLPEIINQHVRKLEKQIKANKEKINKIEQAITLIKDNDNKTSIMSVDNYISYELEQEQIAILCTESIGENNFDVFYEHLSKSVRNIFLPKESIKNVWKDTCDYYGTYEGINNVEVCEQGTTVFIKLSSYGNDFPIRYVFHGKSIVTIQIGGLTFDSRS